MFSFLYFESKYDEHFFYVGDWWEHSLKMQMLKGDLDA